MELDTDFAFRPAQGVGQQVFQDRAVATAGREQRNASPHWPSADDGDGLHVTRYCGHSYCPFSSCPRTEFRLVLAERIFSARRLRSSASIRGMEALMRRSVVLISST